MFVVLKLFTAFKQPIRFINDIQMYIQNTLCSCNYTYTLFTLIKVRETEGEIKNEQFGETGTIGVQKNEDKHQNLNKTWALLQITGAGYRRPEYRHPRTVLALT